MLPALHHLALRTDDVARLAAFYAEAFGLAVVRRRGDESAWLALAGGAVLMIEKRLAGEPRPDAASKDLVAFAVDQEGRQAVKARAIAAGCYDGETPSTVYLRDPDGRRVGASTFDLAAAFD